MINYTQGNKSVVYLLVFTLSCFNPSVSVSALMTLIDFTLSNATRFYSSMGNTSDTEGLNKSSKKLLDFNARYFHL